MSKLSLFFGKHHAVIYLRSFLTPFIYHTFVVSAKSSTGLYSLVKRLIEVIQALQKDTREEQEILYHLAGNLAVRRTAYDVRKYLNYIY
jgi:hypothetical protein